MGDPLRMDKPPRYAARHPRRTQPPTLSGTVTGNQYLPKCGDALRLGSKGSCIIPCVDKRMGAGIYNCVIHR